MDLEPGENVIFEGHPSWRSVLGFYIKGIALAILAGAVAAAVSRATGDEVSTPITGAALVVVLALVLLVGYVRRLFTSYVISDHRLYIRKGIVARHEQQTSIGRVQNVNTNQSVLQRMLRVGTVDFDTAGSDDYEFSFVGVADPQEVVQAVHRAQRDSDSLSARTR